MSSPNGHINCLLTDAHQEQMKHIVHQEAVLVSESSLPRNDIRSDGSRIEGSHKAWNSLHRSYASELARRALLRSCPKPEPSYQP